MGNPALQKALGYFRGNQSEMARAITRCQPEDWPEVTQKNIWVWLNRAPAPPERYAIPVEKATDGFVPRWEWAPHLYPPEEQEDLLKLP